MALAQAQRGHDGPSKAYSIDILIRWHGDFRSGRSGLGPHQHADVDLLQADALGDPVVKLRPVGIDRGMTIPDSFFDPLPDDLLDAFEGRDQAG